MAAVQRAFWIAAAIALAVFLSASARVAREERGGPAHSELRLAGDVPATLFLPRSGDWKVFGDLLPPEERPPGLVLVHGFASDRQGVSGLARRLARSGYAVLTLDLPGHGENRAPFARSFARPDVFGPALSAAVDFLRASPHVDGSRIAVLGHSMGAAAALDYATRDSGIDAAVLISGGFALHGPYRPPNTLFLYASGDPPRIPERARELAARLAGAEGAAPGESTGDPAAGTAVRVAEISGADHLTILFADQTVAEIRAWLAAAFGAPGGDEGPVPDDPRLAPALWALAALPFLYAALGAVTGRLVPTAVELPAAGGAWGLLVLAAALALALPLAAVAPVAELSSLEVADTVLSHFALAGGALLALLAVRGALPVADTVRALPRALPGAALALLGFYATLQTPAVVFHRLLLTPERTFAWAVAALALLPLALARELLLRRGPPLPATLRSVAGRLLLLAALAAGVASGVLSPVVTLMLPSLAVAFALVEVLTASLYASSRNLAAVSLVDAGCIAVVIAATVPIRL